MEVGLGPGLIVLDGDPAPHQKIGAQSPFSAHVFCGQTAGWIKMSLVREIDVGPRDIVLDGDPAPPPKKGHSPQFSAHVCCGQTAGWIKMSLGRELVLRPGHIVLDDPPPPTRKGHSSPPPFCLCLLWPKGRPSQLLMSSCFLSRLSLHISKISRIWAVIYPTGRFTVSHIARPEIVWMKLVGPTV